MAESDEEFANTDELFEAMKRDEAEGAKWLSPIEYAKSRGIKPQLVYHHIRAGHIVKFACECGRPVIDVADTDEFFASKKKEEK